jgi:DNA polymerase III subunit delta
VLYILWGEDEFSQQEKLREIKAGLGEDSMLSSNTNTFEGQKLTVEELGAVAGAIPFLSARRLVIIHGLLERFESSPQTSPAKKTPSNRAEESQKFADCLKALPESSLVVMIDRLEARKNPAKNNLLFQALAGRAEVLAYAPLKNIQLFQWVQDRASRKGGSLSRQATNVLVELIGSDLFTLNNEIDKLVAYTAGRQIEEKDIRMVVSAAQEATIYELVDAILDRKPGPSEDFLHELLQKGFAAPQILAALARQTQVMFQIKEMKSQKKPASEIQTRVGIYNAYAWSKVAGRTDKFTLDKLRLVYEKLVEADLAIKTGRFEGDLVLDLLVAELSQK